MYTFGHFPVATIGPQQKPCNVACFLHTYNIAAHCWKWDVVSGHTHLLCCGAILHACSTHIDCRTLVDSWLVCQGTHTCCVLVPKHVMMCHGYTLLTPHTHLQHHCKCAAIVQQMCSNIAATLQQHCSTFASTLLHHVSAFHIASHGHYTLPALLLVFIPLSTVCIVTSKPLWFVRRCYAGW